MIRGGLTGRDVLSRSRDFTQRPLGLARVPTGDDEATADFSAPAPRRRLDRRTRWLLAGAAVAAVLVNAGAALTYWHVTGTEGGRANAGAVVEMTLRGRADLRDLTITVPNDNDFPIRITSVAPAGSHVVADDEHRVAGCSVATRHPVRVQWDVPGNSAGAFTVPGWLAVSRGTEQACAGAIFTVPVRVAGLAGAPE